MEHRPSISTTGPGVGGGGPLLSPANSGAALASTGSTMPTNAASSGSAFTATNGKAAQKRKRESISGMESSPGSVDAAEDDPEDKRSRQPGVKRACNECRQQKLRCNVRQDPFQACSRCHRLGLECKIESNFKRVGKRSRQAEMARQIERLQQALQQARASGFIQRDQYDDDEINESPTTPTVHTRPRNPSLMGNEEAVSSLLRLSRSGGGQYPLPFKYKLGSVEISEGEASALFDQYFNYYHRFLPFLARQPPRVVFEQQHPLLFWSIISVAARRWTTNPGLLRALEVPLTRLVWDTIAGLPTSYHVVKGLCLLCTWRLPTSSTASDPTHVLCGTMMKIATGIGLHRPSHVRDFSRDAVNLNAEQVHDRVVTWAVCNIVAQSVGTGYGQPASSLYDWTSARPEDKGSFALSEELNARLRIEMFCDSVSKEMYSNGSDPWGVAGDERRALLMRVYKQRFLELQYAVEGPDTPVVSLHLEAALLHLRLAGFYDSTETKSYRDDLVALWQATIAFLKAVTRDMEDPESSVLPFMPNYLQQMLIAGGFSLLRLLGCGALTPLVDVDLGQELFHRSVAAIRVTSVTNNDLQGRLAELMVQMWNGHRVALQAARSHHNDDGTAAVAAVVDDSMQLKVRCRHSVSHVYDSIWRWRVEFLETKRSSLDALSQQATNPESVSEAAAAAAASSSSASSSAAAAAAAVAAAAAAAAPSLSLDIAGPVPQANGLGTSLELFGGRLGALGEVPVTLAPGPIPTALNGFGPGLLPTGEMDLFAPNAWLLDSLVNFPYSDFSGMDPRV